MERGYFYTGPQQSVRDFEELIREDEDPYFRMPTHKVVCDRCRGEGSHDPWAGAVEPEAFEDPDFEGDYLAGHYDVSCEECRGANVVDEVNRDGLTAEMLARWDAWEQDVWSSNRESAMERAMGC